MDLRRACGRDPAAMQSLAPTSIITHELRVAKSERRGNLALQGTSRASRPASPLMSARPVNTSSVPPVELHSLQYDVIRQLSNAKMERRALRSPRCSQTSTLAATRSTVLSPRGRVRLSSDSSGLPSLSTQTPSKTSGGDPAWATVATPTLLGLPPGGNAPSPVASPPKSPSAEISPAARQANTRHLPSGQMGEADAPVTTPATVRRGPSSPAFAPPPRRGSTRPVRPVVPKKVFRHKELEALIRCASAHA